MLWKRIDTVKDSATQAKTFLNQWESMGFSKVIGNISLKN